MHERREREIERIERDLRLGRAQCDLAALQARLAAAIEAGRREAEEEWAILSGHRWPEPPVALGPAWLVPMGMDESLEDANRRGAWERGVEREKRVGKWL